MLSFPYLTDSPAPSQSRDGIRARWGRIDDLAARAVAKRIVARQWGNATPAQALLALASFADAVGVPTADAHGITFEIDPADNLAVQRHWDLHATVKEANALIRLLDRDYGKAGRDLYIARVAWLVTASQPDIQAYLRTLALPAPSAAGRVQLPGKHGCTGFLMHSELFPRPARTAKVVYAVPGEDAILDLFGSK